MVLFGLRSQEGGARIPVRPGDRTPMEPLPVRILIVEDNPDDGELLLRQLKKAELDSHVRIITDGGVALDFLRDESSKPENLVTVFLDLDLPQVSGLQLLEEIRSRESIKHLPVIFMTSSNAPEQIKRCRELGAAFVPKPITFSTFTKAVADRFHSKRASDRGTVLPGGARAIADGRGSQLIADMMGDFRRSGLSEKEAVHEMILVLDAFQAEDEACALVLIKHLREWIDGRASPIDV